MPSFDVVSEVDIHELTNCRGPGNAGADPAFRLQERRRRLRTRRDDGHHERQSGLSTQADAGDSKIANLETRHRREVSGSQRRRGEYRHRHTGCDPPERNRCGHGPQGDEAAQGFENEGPDSNSGDKVRITGKKRDDLQEAIALLRKADVEVPLQFNNFRD